MSLLIPLFVLLCSKSFVKEREIKNIITHKEREIKNIITHKEREIKNIITHFVFSMYHSEPLIVYFLFIILLRVSLLKIKVIFLRHLYFTVFYYHNIS